MRMRVVRMRERGVALDRAQLRSAEGVVGDLYVEEHVDEVHGRTLRIARLAPERPRDPVLLPPLRDVQLLWIGGYGCMLTGIEHISDAAFAQSWWCRSC